MLIILKSVALTSRISALTENISVRKPQKSFPDLLITLFIAILSFADVSSGAEFEAHPSLAVNEEYTDNVYETKAGRTSDFITRILPGIALSYKAPALTGELSYVFDYRYYARNSRNDESTHTLNAKGNLIAVKNLLFLDVSDEYQRVSLDVTRDASKESLFVNQSDRNVATVSPYLVLYPTERLMLKPGYKYVDTRYIDSTGVDKYDHIAFLNMSYELTKRWSLTTDYTFTREIADIDNYDLHQILGGFRYEYADKSFIFGQVGYSWLIYDSGQNLNSIVWNAGLSHQFDTVTATINTGVKYDEDPERNITKESFVNSVLEKRLKRGTLSISPMYSEFVQTETDSVQTRKYGATVRGQFELVTDLSGSLSFTVEKYEQPLIDSYTRRFQFDSVLSYLLAKQLSLSLSYFHTNYNSPNIETDNYFVNRVSLELKKTF